MLMPFVSCSLTKQSLPLVVVNSTTTAAASYTQTEVCFEGHHYKAAATNSQLLQVKCMKLKCA